MKIYTKGDVERLGQIGLFLAIVLGFCALGAILASLWILKNIAVSVLAVCMFAYGLHRILLQREDFKTVKSAFLADKDFKVLEYFSEEVYLKGKDIERGGYQIIPHKLDPVDGRRQIQLVVNEKIMTICVRAKAFCHARKQQLYFDKFLRRTGRMPASQEIVDNLLAVFLRQHEAVIPEMYTMQSDATNVEFESEFGSLLAGYLMGELALSGLHLDSVACTIDVKSSIIS